MNCNACRRFLEANSFLHCRLCKHDYHYKCLNIKSSQFAALSEEFLLSWVCPACTNVTRRNKPNCNTPVGKNLLVLGEDSMNMSYEASLNDTIKSDGVNEPQIQQASTSQPSDAPITLEKMGQMMDEKLNSFLSYYLGNLRTSLRTDMEGMIRERIEVAKQEIMDDFTATTDFVSQEQRGLKSQMESHESIIKNLE